MLGKANIKNIQRWMEEIDQFNETPGDGTTRAVFSKEDLSARNYVKKEMLQIGLEVKEDGAGNIYGILPGTKKDMAQVWTGSHIDTVPNGGKFDGMAGVFAGMEAVRLLKESKIPIKRSLSVNVYTGEEMGQYGVCCIGSRSLAGKLHKKDLQSNCNPQGKSLYQRLSELEYDLFDFDNNFQKYRNVYASIELHIEQNNILEKNQIPIGIVSGICAPTNLMIEVHGVQSHAGGTSMNDRRDAYMAAAEVSLLLEKLALHSESPYITATIGQMYLEPNAINVIPGYVKFSVDIRSIRLKDKEKLLKDFKLGMLEIEKQRKVKISCHMQNHDAPILCNEHLRKILKKQCEELKISYMDIVSGAYHDSLLLGEFTNAAMIFIPCKDGISHSKEELAEYEDIAQGAQLLAKTMLKLGNESNE